MCMQVVMILISTTKQKRIDYLLWKLKNNKRRQLQNFENDRLLWGMVVMEWQANLNTRASKLLQIHLLKPYLVFWFILIQKIGRSLCMLKNVWVPTLPIDQSRFFFILGMQDLITPKDRIVRIEHVGVISKLLSWILKVDHAKVRKWVMESEDHVEFQGKEFEDVLDWMKWLEMASKVHGYDEVKFFKIVKLNL